MISRTDKKKFKETVKPAFSVEPRRSRKIVLIGNDEIISNDADVAEKFSQFFVNITKSLSISENTKRQCCLRVYLSLFLLQSSSSLFTTVLKGLKISTQILDLLS